MTGGEARPMAESARKTDGALLGEYVARGSADAFDTLVQRHGPMVLAACSRMLGSHDAEDAAQAVFLLLARKARGLLGKADLGPWLHRAASYVASTARRERNRRERHEREAAAMRSAAESGADVWREIGPYVDEAVEALPRRYRDVMTLCYFEGRTQREAAELLGKPEGTVASLRARALEKLRGRLARKSVVVTATALGATLAAQGARAATLPASLAPSIQAALAGTTTAGRVAVLVEGAAKAMLLAKAKAVALVASLALGIAACVGVAGSRLSDRSSAAGPVTVATTPRLSRVWAAVSADLGREVVGFLRFGDWTYICAPEWNATFGVGELDFPRLIRARRTNGKLVVEDLTKPVEGEREWAQVANMNFLDGRLLIIRFDKSKLVDIGEVTASQDIPDEFRAFASDGSPTAVPEGVRYEYPRGVLAPEGASLDRARWETGGRTENERYGIAWATSGFLHTRESCGMHHFDYHSLAYRRGGARASQFVFCQGLAVT
ncbi:MAG: RNA polymerase sigma factor, partial [Planctomycetota bacterium]